MNRSLELTPELLRLYSRRGNFHSDPDAAAALGYRHLVAQGMQVAGPAYGLLLERWGDDFLAHGTIELKFVSPVVDGETVDARVDADDEQADDRSGEPHPRPDRGRRDRASRHGRRPTAMTGLTAHPWNTGFRWTDHEGPFRAVTTEQAKAYDEQGFFVLEDAVDPETLAAVAAGIDPFDREVVEFLQTQPDGRFSIAGVDTVSIAVHLAPRSRVLHDFCASRLFADLAHDLVGPDVRLYWEQSVVKRPRGTEPVLWHQDNGYTYVEPQTYLTCWVALTDATLDNGCVWVLPGVHRRGTLAHRDTPIGFECCRDPEGAVAVPVTAGSVVVFSSLTPHATGRNTTDSVRTAYILQYAPDGAVALHGDAANGAPTDRIAQNDPRRQFPVLVHGERPAVDRP